MISYSFPTADGFLFDPGKLLLDLEAAGVPPVSGMDITSLEITLRFPSILTAAQQVTAGSIIQTTPPPTADVLASAKQDKFRLIDQRTGKLIAGGVVYQGRVFSLSVNAQATLLGAYSYRTSLVYPLTWNTLDDMGTMELADVAAVEAFFAAAVEDYRAHLDSGTALKNQVRGATTLAGVLAIVDPR